MVVIDGWMMGCGSIAVMMVVVVSQPIDAMMMMMRLIVGCQL